MLRWPGAAFLICLVSGPAHAEDTPPASIDDVLAIAKDKNIKLKMDKLKNAIATSTFTWTYADVYQLVDLDLAPEIVMPAAQKAQMFWNNPKSMNAIVAAASANVQPETVTIGSNADFVVLFEEFNDIRNGWNAADAQVAPLAPRQAHESDNDVFLRERKRAEQVAATAAPWKGRIAATTFDITLTGDFTPYDGACTKAHVMIDLSKIDFSLYRYTLGGKAVDLPLKLDGANVESVAFQASGVRRFEAYGKPICTSSTAAATLAEQGSKLRITMKRPVDSDQWSGTAEFLNAKTGAKL